MDAKIKDGFDSLAIQREDLTKLINNNGDVQTKRLKYWPLFITACVIAENYQSDVRKKLKLEIAFSHLNEAKIEMKQYGIRPDDFNCVENALKSVIEVIGKVVAAKYKSNASDIREEAVAPTLSK